MVDRNLYIYAYDEEGDLVFIKKPNKYVVIGGKEEKSIVTTTDIPENAQHYFETSDARAMIEYIQNGDVVFDDENVDTEKLKLAYKDQYGNFYDRLTDKVIYVNDYGDELGESMKMEFSEAKQILNESGYQLIDESVELSDEAIDKAKDILMGDDYGYPYDSVEAAFDHQDAWISDVNSDTPDDIASAVSDFLDNLSDEELEEIGAI